MGLDRRSIAAAAAVGVFGVGTAQAAASVAFLPAMTYTYSEEGLRLAGAAPLTLPTIRVTFGNSLTYQDNLLLVLPGITPLSAVPSMALVVCTAGPGSTVGPPTLGYVGTVSAGWNFRVTSVHGVTVGDHCDFTPLEVQGASLAKSNGLLEYQALRFITGQRVDYASSSTSIAIRSQFGISGNGLPAVAPAYIRLNAEINVYSGRTKFTPASTETVGAGAAPAPFPTRNDSLSFITTVDGDGVPFTGPTVTVTSQTLSIEGGNFEWTDTTSPAGICFDSGIAAFPLWSIDPASTCNSLTLVGPLASTLNAGYFQITGTSVLSPADWTGTARWTYSLGTATGVTELSWDPGAWTMNGVQVYIQYLPYGEGVSRIVYVAHSGLLAADAEADIYVNGARVGCDLGTMPARQVTQLTAAIDACAAAAGIMNERVAVLLTFAAPDADIEVYSAYNVGGSDRGTVINTSNGRGLTYPSRGD